LSTKLSKMYSENLCRKSPCTCPSNKLS
jgi:hypothetical protein